MASYTEIYQGADDNLTPKYQTGYQESIAGLGMSLDPRTANQLGEINHKLNPGTRHVEVSAISPQVFDSIPEEHLDEIKRLTKLTGTSASIHAPLVEASGVGERGWTKENQLGAERQIENAMLRSHKLDPKGNISVTFHSTAQLPDFQPKIKTKDGEEITGLMVINSKTGQIAPINPQKRYFEQVEKGELKEEPIPFDPKTELNKINEDQWSSELAGVNRYADYGDQELRAAKRELTERNIPEEVFLQIAKGVDLDKLKEEHQVEKDIAKATERRIVSGQIYLRDSYRAMKGLFDNAWEAAVEKGNKKDQEILKRFANEVSSKISPNMEKNPQKINELKNVIDKGLKTLRNIDTPEVFEPLHDFVIKQSSTTYANVAKTAYKKYGETAPIMNIENPPAGGGLSRAEDLKELIDATREKLSKQLVKEGMGRSEAERTSKKMVGATWDVGHINMMRKKGYSEEDVIKQTEIIAPYVKHVHLSDNFGLDHTELPMGMGNVPLKEMMKRLGEKGFEGKKIIEVGDWWQHFAEKGGGNPFRPTIQAFDSPIYAMKASPGWAQADVYRGYYSGHGPINPPIHHQTYGASFQALPTELGGEIPGNQSRFAGAPNQ